MSVIYDVGIIGAGPAGIFAATKIAKDHKNVKAIIFDLGRPCGKRRRPGEGYFGMFPSSDGKLFTNDIASLVDITTLFKTNKANKWFSSVSKNIIDSRLTKDNLPSKRLINKIKSVGLRLKTNNHIQLYPQDIHTLSKYTHDLIVEAGNITLSFDNEIFNIIKHKNQFHIESYSGNFVCKKIILCVGRGGWRWAQSIFKSFGLIEENNLTKFGVKVEMPASYMKDFNQSNCQIYNENVEIGPFSWHGTVVPEDQLDFAISAFRSNESRWKTDKVSFNLISNRIFENEGFEQTDRIGQLTFIISNERIVKEKINTIFNNKSKLCILPEYNWLANVLNEIKTFIPDILEHGYMHFPTLIPMVSKINLNNNLLTDVPGMFVAGETAGHPGLLFAILSGIIAADAVCK